MDGWNTKRGQAAAVEGHIVAAALELERRVDGEIDALEQVDDADLEAIRQKKLCHWKQLAEKKRKWIEAGHGEYSELFSDKEFFEQINAKERAICHFYRDSTACEVMHKHLQKLASDHVETKFVKVRADKTPFLVERLRVWMLPTLALIKNGRTVDYVVGLSELADGYDFSTSALADRLRKSGVLFEEEFSKSKLNHSSRESATLKQRSADGAEDSDFD